MPTETEKLTADSFRILREVARSGTCSRLAWHGEKENPGADLNHSKTLPTRSYPPLSSQRRIPPRKKQKLDKRRLSKKHPLFLVRTITNTTDGLPTTGSGRTSGSEPDDSTQYEYDSEGTSTTTNSEISSSQQRLNVGASPGCTKFGEALLMADEQCLLQSLRTLQYVFRNAVGIVLDNFFSRGGYKLSPAERLRSEIMLSNQSTENNESFSSREMFLERRHKLLGMLRLPLRTGPVTHSITPISMETSNGPPFTIQRIAEVLLAPEKYYTQTHKLCNCLEKLLLVTTSTGAFGGSTGGRTWQSHREGVELAALADERERQESELRQKRAKRRATSPSAETLMEVPSDHFQPTRDQPFKEEISISETMKRRSPKEMINFDGNTVAILERGPSVQTPSKSSRELLDSAAQVSSRTRIDYVGIDRPSYPDRNVLAIPESRALTNSPPPPSLALSTTPSNLSLLAHVGVPGFVRQHAQEKAPDHHGRARVPSAVLFQPSAETGTSNMHSSTCLRMLQLHNNSALGGISLGRSIPSSLDLQPDDVNPGVFMNRQSRGSSDAQDLDVEQSRSSASNSDVDSEYDDLSLDDSASDRSDGSDSGSGAVHEPFAAARAMALNRMQQQQRLQTRVLTSYPNEQFRPPADYEYQSGDSIDSMRAEDSGGSDSSSQSSDIAD